jgi:hypothetical protein
MNQLNVAPVPKDKIWVSQVPLWRSWQVTVNEGEMAFLTGIGKALSNLSYAFFPLEDQQSEGCETQITNRIQTEIPLFSNSGEVVHISHCQLQACMSDNLGKQGSLSHFSLQFSMWKMHSIRAFPTHHPSTPFLKRSIEAIHKSHSKR